MLATVRDQQRFIREVTAAGQLSGHPHVVAVYDAGVLADSRPYMVLELCPGGSLGDRLHQQGLPVQAARDIGVGIADALAAAHATGVLHRDIKPGNIMVNQYGRVALADFGLAAMPRPGQELSVTREALTPAYAPPEAFDLAEPTPAVTCTPSARRSTPSCTAGPRTSPNWAPSASSSARQECSRTRAEPRPRSPLAPPPRPRSPPPRARQRRARDRLPPPRTVRRPPSTV